MEQTPDSTKPDTPPLVALAYQSPRDEREARRRGGSGGRVVGGCLSSAGLLAVLIFVTCGGGLRLSESALSPVWITAGVALPAVGLALGLRRRRWGFLIGVAISYLMLLGLGGLLFAICGR